MARGVRKPIEEKIAAKEEIISALSIRIESEKRELKELYEEKKKRELETVNDLITAANLNTNEITVILKQYIESRELQTVE